MAIETAPIIAKLLAPKGEYDYKFEEQESVVATWVTQKVEQRKLLLSTDASMNQKIYEEIKSEEELHRYKKEKAEELLRLQADSFQNTQLKRTLNQIHFFQQKGCIHRFAHPFFEFVIEAELVIFDGGIQMVVQNV